MLNSELLEYIYNNRDSVDGYIISVCHGVPKNIVTVMDRESEIYYSIYFASDFKIKAFDCQAKNSYKGLVKNLRHLLIDIYQKIPSP